MFVSVELPCSELQDVPNNQEEKEWDPKGVFYMHIMPEGQEEVRANLFGTAM